jgi:ribosomal protein S12 methylthiotransferase
LQQIDEDVAYKVRSGVREITLIAQDTGRWGQDFPVRSSLAQLMDFLAKKYPQTWFRVLYIQPEGVTDELLSVLAKNDNICSYLDIPFQHASKPILRAMNRRGSAESFLALIRKARQTIPEVTLRTTLIAGFPGETEEQFDEMLGFIEEAELDYVGVFPYSREEGTRAADMENQIDDAVKQERAQAVRDLADTISAARIAERVGTRMPVLVLGVEEDGQLFGRAQCQAPDVDGVTYVAKGSIGEIVEAEITGTLMYEMEGD